MASRKEEITEKLVDWYPKHLACNRWGQNGTLPKLKEDNNADTFEGPVCASACPSIAQRFS